MKHNELPSIHPVAKNVFTTVDNEIRFSRVSFVAKYKLGNSRIKLTCLATV